MMTSDLGRYRRLLDHRPTMTALSGFVLVASLFSYGFRMARVRGESMTPTYYDGQWLLVRRMDWPAPPLQDGDVIVFRLGRDLLVKRIAAVPGQPMPDAEPYWPRRPWGDHLGQAGAELAGPPVVPTGYLYVLGDNAAVSDDSRSFGPVPMTAVLGRVLRWGDPGRGPTTEAGSG